MDGKKCRAFLSPGFLSESQEINCSVSDRTFPIYLFSSSFLQITGSAVLFIGVWLAVDKTSFIHLTRFSTLNTGVEVKKTHNSSSSHDAAISLIFLEEICFQVSFYFFSFESVEIVFFLHHSSIFLIFIPAQSICVFPPFVSFCF